MRFRGVIFLILALVVACKSDKPPVLEQKIEWFIGFEDGTEIKINSPKYIAAGYKCGSGEYDPESNRGVERLKLVSKYVRVKGYIVRIDGRMTYVPICQEIQ